MAKFAVLLEFSLNNEKDTSTVEVEAMAVVAGPDWISFYSDTKFVEPYNVVAVFPITRVVSVAKTD
jgi:hypothetical protein